MIKAELLHAIAAASAALGVAPVTEGTNPELEAHLKLLEQQLADKAALEGDGGEAEPQTGGGTTQPKDPEEEQAEAATGSVQVHTGGGTTQPTDPEEEAKTVLVASDITIETKRKDGTKLRLVKGEPTQLSADDYALVGVLDYVKRI